MIRSSVPLSGLFLLLAACGGEEPPLAADPMPTPLTEPKATDVFNHDARMKMKEALGGTSWWIGEKKPSKVTLHPDGSMSSKKIKQAKGGQWDITDRNTIILSSKGGITFIWMTFDEDRQTAEALWKSGVTSQVRRD